LIDAYFDTSAILNMLLAEPGALLSDAVWMVADSVAAPLLLYVEARSAIARARRGRRISPADAGIAVQDLNALAARLDFVEPSRGIVWRAAALAEVHRLRGYDAVHLASAIEAATTTVVTSDLRLAEAARAEGLLVHVPA
jgi:predicted nucleic acid-binding protein